jgi:membrane fusion protein, multidrug efflux system
VVGDYYGDKDIVIMSGLRAGDRVVVEGMLKVAPGQPVRIATTGAAKDGGATRAGGSTSTRGMSGEAGGPKK